MNRLIQLTALALGLLALVALTSGCEAHSAGDQVVFGGARTVRADEPVNGNLAVFGGTVTIEEDAEIAGDLAVFGGTVTLEGTVRGDVANFGGTIERGENALILGEVATVGGSERGAEPIPPIDPERPDPPAAPEAPEPPSPFERPRLDLEAARPTFTSRVLDLVGGIISTILKTIAFGALGLVLTLFLPDHVRRVGQAAEQAPLPSMAVGCLTIPALLVAMVLAAITLIGIPIAILIPFAATAAAIFGWIGLGFFLGDRLLRAADVRSPRPAAAAAIGSGGLVVASTVMGVIPILGWLVSPFLWAWGLGATILTRGGTQHYPTRPRLDEPVPPPTLDPLAGIEPAPRAKSGSGNLFADLAADLGIEDEIYGDEDDGGPNRPEKPVPPPNNK